MAALRRCLEDPFQEEKAKSKMQKLWQGSSSVADFTSEFHQLAGQIRDWPESVIIHFYKKALDPELAQWGTIGGGPPTLAGWHWRAGETEIRMLKAQSYRHRSSPRRLSPLPRPQHPIVGTPHPRGDPGTKESQYVRCRWLGLCHMATACPEKKVVVPFVVCFGFVQRLLNHPPIVLKGKNPSRQVSRSRPDPRQ
uniref:Uncharacterized protein n=1 Tax=Sphaerodactylus townsendi TaxID=933632 RepID=A0ACB8E6N7_9SAUR